MTQTDRLPAPYAIHRPQGSGGPLVFASPHSGTVYPFDMAACPTLSPASLRSAEDALVDRLIAAGPDHGAAVITAVVGRAYVDLNRDPAELDPALVDDVPDTPPGPRIAAGYGVVARLAGDGARLYDRRLPLAEAEARIARVHRPYHDALAGLLDEARARCGVAVLVDWHSMPSGALGPISRAVRPPDVILGDRHGAACSGRLTRCLRSLFESAGWRVGLNQPYAGGYTTQRWGRPAEGFQAVQVELNRGLYLDEASGRPGEGFDRTRRIIERVMAGLAAEDWRA